MYKVSKLVQRKNKNTNRKEWALISRNKPYRVLKWFGTAKPTKEEVLKEEKRVQWFKHNGEQIIGKIHKVAGSLYGKNLIHIADALIICIQNLVLGELQEKNSIKISKLINMLNKRGEVEASEKLSDVLLDVLSFEKGAFKACEFKFETIESFNEDDIKNSIKKLNNKDNQSEVEKKKIKELKIMLEILKD